MTRAWGIKLGSGGAAVRFCEEHHLVGVGWRNIDTQILQTGTREELAAHVRATCDWYETAHQRGRATGALWRFGRECAIGDYVVYYDPAGKRVRICRVVGDVERRAADGDKPDIWQTRRVEYPREAIPIPDLHAVIRGSLLSPRGTFWEIRAVDVVEKLANGVPPSQVGVTDDALAATFQALSDQVCKRLQLLNPDDWEVLVADYFAAQGATIAGRIGGSQAVIDFEAYFQRGTLGAERWRVQVKRLQDQKVDWPAIDKDATDAGKQTNHKFCFVSVFGFTADAHAQAAMKRVQLLEAADFVLFVIGATTSRGLRPELRTKLALPAWPATAPVHGGLEE